MRNLFVCLLAVTTTFIVFNSCTKEVSTEYGQPASGALQTSAGDCLPKTVEGSYVAAKTLNNSNFIEVSVTVINPGPYSIYTDSVNGYSFKGTGTFNTAGTNKVKLKGAGTPVGSGVDNFTVFFDSSFCDIAITVLPAGSSGGPATFALAGAPAGCTFTPFGSYFKDTTLDNRHTVSLTVNVAIPGTYSINTSTLNGYYFTKTGTFSTPGNQQVTLQGTGKPLAAGTDNFTVTAGGSSCNFPITVNTGTPPAGACTGTMVQGTYTAGTATNTTNKVVVTHTYAAAGPYTVSTGTVNGYSFATTGFIATTGSNTVTLNASGTPTAAGVNTFTVSFADGTTCTFTATVAAAPPVVNNDYFPVTQNSYWTYNDGPTNADTFKVTVNGTQVFGTTTYQKFTYTGATTGNEYYRKDAGTGFFYQSFDTAYFGSGLSFSQARLDVLFLKNTLATGDSLVSDFNGTFSGGPAPIPVTWRVKYKVINSNATITVNGKTFTNVYQLRDFWEYGVAGMFQDAGAEPYDYYYARGVGLIRILTTTESRDIRFWMVN